MKNEELFDKMVLRIKGRIDHIYDTPNEKMNEILNSTISQEEIDYYEEYLNESKMTDDTIDFMLNSVHYIDKEEEDLFFNNVFYEEDYGWLNLEQLEIMKSMICMAKKGFSWFASENDSYNAMNSEITYRLSRVVAELESWMGKCKIVEYEWVD